MKASHTATMSLGRADKVVRDSVAHFRSLCTRNGKIDSILVDEHQVALYDLAHLATRLMAANKLLEHSASLDGDERAGSQLVHQLALLYTADTLKTVHSNLVHREEHFGLLTDTMSRQFDHPEIIAFLKDWLSYDHYNSAAELIEEVNTVGENSLSTEHLALQASFRRYATEKVAPLAEQIHREDLLLPEQMITELAGMGCFGVSIPEKYGGFAQDDHPDHMAMIIIADELSRVSIGTAGSLGTRPELLAKALLQGGTESQKLRWLPIIAVGEKQTAVAVTEPDYGSNVGGIMTTARPVKGGWRLNGKKMWATFAGRADILMVLARTDTDLSKGHRGLSLFIVEKPPFAESDGHEFKHETNGGQISGRAIATIGYRGMHSFELAFDNYFVPADNLIGGEAGIGHGFYLQMHGFTASRLQTAGRALGLMAAAFAGALRYTREREVFGRSLISYPLTRNKLVRMAMHIQASRRLTYHAAHAVDAGMDGSAAAMAKLLTARAAEWITRDAQQLHGGMGYAEEFPISRHFADARVLAIFEGAEEVLALRVIARNLMQEPVFEY